MSNKRLDALTTNHSLAPLLEQKQNMNSGCGRNGIIFQDKLKGCVMVEVHQRCM
jgi:hypothetical protein